MQITPLKFGGVEILQFEVSEFEFYPPPQKFGGVCKISRGKIQILTLKGVVRDRRGALKKVIWVLWAPLFWGNCVESPLIYFFYFGVIVWSRHLFIFFIKKIRKNKIQLHVQKFFECY